MFRFKKSHLLLALALVAPVSVYAANFCISSGGGFGGGGTSYIAPTFTIPAAYNCVPWSGFTKTADTVVLFATGTACMAANNKVLTFSIFNTDPAYLGAGASDSDYITLCPKGVTGCPLTGSDTGSLGGGGASEETCTGALLLLPWSHD